MEQNPLFRKAALDKLASPERLDVLMRVTSPAGWLALLTLGLVVCGVVAWSILGTIPEIVEGRGQLTREGGSSDATASLDGVLKALTIATGQTVTKGQVIGKISAIRETQGVRNREENYRITRASAERNIAALKDDILRLTDTLQQRKARLSKMEANRAGYGQTEIDRVADEIRSTESQIEGKRAGIQGQQAEVERARIAMQSEQVVQAETEDVRAPVAGTIIEVVKKNDEKVRSGEKIATIETAGGPIEAVFLVSDRVGKDIKKGMPARIYLENLSRQEDGYIVGRVTDRAEFVITAEKAKRLFADTLANDLLGSGSKYEVHAELVKSETTPSGYQWSSKQGPSLQVSTGTTVSMAVIVDERPPYELVIPKIKSIVGID